jgi:hypothetical protein
MVNSFLLAITLTAISLCVGFIIFLYKHDRQDKKEICETKNKK